MTKFTTIKCPNCGSNLNVDIGNIQTFCQYCGTKLYLDANMDDVSKIVREKEKTKRHGMTLDYYDKQETRAINEKKTHYWLIGIGVIVAFISLLVLGVSENKRKQEIEMSIAQLPHYEMVIHVKCKNNLLLNRYDVNVYADEIKLGNVEHGGENQFVVSLPEGEHDLNLEKCDDRSVSGTYRFFVEKDDDMYFEINTSRKDVAVSKVDEWTEGVSIDEIETEEIDGVAEDSSADSEIDKNVDETVFFNTETEIETDNISSDTE